MMRTYTPPSFSFLFRNEVGSFINSHDWSDHRLGTIDSWDSTLLNTLNIILESGFPMFLYWGEEKICFYNDAFKPSFGEGSIQFQGIGKPLEAVYPEAFHVINSLIEEVIQTDQKIYAEDVPGAIMRNGELVDTTWTYSYSPVKNLDGATMGVLAVCIETTEKQNAFKVSRANEVKFQKAFLKAPVGFLIINRVGRTVDFANDMYLMIVDNDTSCFGKNIWDVIPEAKAQGFDKVLDSVFDTGVAFRSAEHEVILKRNGVLHQGHYTFSYEPVLEDDGTVSAVMVLVIDVTEHVQTRKKIQLAEERLRQAVEATQLGTFDFNLISEELVASERFYQIFGFVYNAPHRGLVETIHVDDRKIRDAAHRRAYATGHLSYESRIVWKNGKVRWVRINGNVLYDDDRNPIRIIGSVLDVTDEKEIRGKLTETAERLGLALKAGKLGSFEFEISSERLSCSEQCKANFGLAADDVLTMPKFFASIVAEDRELVKRTLEISISNNLPYEAQYRVRWPDKSIHLIHAAALPMADQKGQVSRLIGVTIEMNNKKSR